MRRVHLLLAVGVVAVAAAGWVRWRWSQERPAARHLRAAARLYAAGKTTEASREWQIATALDPKSVEAREALGRIYLDSGAVALAIREFRIVTELAPRRPHAYCRLAAALREGGVSDLALQAARYAVRTDGRCARAHGTLGLVLSDRQEFKEAAAELERAAALAPQDAGHHLNLARIYAGLAQLPQAEAAARSAYRLDSKDPHAAYLLGHLLVLKGDADGFEEARSLLQAAVAADPSNAAARVDLAKIHRRSGRLPAARAELARALEQDPRSREALQALAEVTADLGDAKRAASLRERVRALAAEDLARKELERRLAQQPLDRQALVRLGDLYARDGQYPQAAALLERARRMQDDADVQRRLKQVRDAAARRSRTPDA